MTGKRDKLSMFVDILVCVKKGEEKPTRIMYKANLSWIPLMKKLDILTEQGLLERTVDNGRRCYKITPKGVQFLSYIYKAEELSNLPLIKSAMLI